MGPVWNAQLYEAYDAKWVLWCDLGRSLQEKARAAGLKVAPSFWCLTAGPQKLHEDPALAEAVARDIEGRPIPVPWGADQSYQGTPTWFGCTNAPAFQALLRERADAVAAQHPDGLHIDDPLGTLAPADWGGGCYCGHCVAGFRAWLAAHDSQALRAEAGVEDWKGFDYAALVRQSASSRAAVISRAAGLPLRREFIRFQLEARYEGLRALRDRVRMATRPDLPFSLNAYYDRPGSYFTALVPLTTHQVAEVMHHAELGTARLWDAAQAYRQAEALNRPLASTAGGSDYAWVKAHDAVDLPKIWIALAFAMGQRMMVPNPERQWCHTPELGTHWYAAPVEAYAPLYAFAREHADLLEGFKTFGPTAVRSVEQVDLLKAGNREAFAKDLLACEGPFKAGEHVWVFPRRHKDGRVVVHLVNTQYSVGANLVAPAVGVEVRVPAAWLPADAVQMHLQSPGQAPQVLELIRQDDEVVFLVPGFDVWALASARPN